MLWTIIGILIILWILGMVFHLAAGFIHILLIIAVILIIVNVIKGRSSRT
ncbi:lmo0937 family membrane protein [Actinomycetes bacterium NPDC127524]